MKSIFDRMEYLAITAGAAALVFSLQTPVRAADAKPRVIATTDGEVDDHSSMIRFLL